jgi:hypothetical protein
VYCGFCSRHVSVSVDFLLEMRCVSVHSGPGWSLLGFKWAILRMNSCVERRYLNQSHFDIAHSRLPWLSERDLALLGFAIWHGMGLRFFARLYVNRGAF